MYVVYDLNDRRIQSTFETEAGAKVSMKATNKRLAKRILRELKDGWKRKTLEQLVAEAPTYEVVSLEFYDANIRTTKTVRNLMNGAEIQIDINTPLCCDPSSETYWCM